MPTYSDVANTSIMHSGGVRCFQYAGLDSDGCPMGKTGTIAQGSQAGMGIHKGTKTAGGAGAEPRIVVWSGDDGLYRAQMPVAAAELPRLELTVAPYNGDFHALATGTKLGTVGASTSEWNVAAEDSNADVNTNQLCLLFNIIGQDADVYFGQQRWMNLLYPVTSVYPMYGAHAEAAATDYSYRGLPTQATKYPWGTAFSKVVDGATKAARRRIFSRNPLTMHTLVGNAAATTLNLDYTPASDHTGYVVKVFNFDTQTELTPTTQWTCVPGLKQIRLVSAPAAAIRIVAVYEAFDMPS
jgi:hypothetical protein